MTIRTVARAAALAVVVAAAPAAAQTPITLGFEGVATNAQGFLSALPAQSGFVFENFGAYASTTSFGTGNNASSGTKFAYAYANAGSAFVYRADNLNFNFLSAALSFRALDGNVTPAQLTVNAYRTGFNPVFSRTLTVTNSAQLFAFNWADVNELEFVTDGLDAPGSAVLALDDVTLSTVPEPGSIVLLATGLGAVGLVGARRRKASQS